MKAPLLAFIFSASLGGCVYSTSSKVQGSIVSVETRVPGASPEAIEASVVKPMENALVILEDVKEVRSTASQGRSYLEVHFKTKEQAKHLHLAQRAVEAVQASLPLGTSGPVVANREFPSLK